MHKRLCAALGAALLLTSLGACGNAQPLPEPSSPSTSKEASKPATSSALVTVDGSGFATDVTITVIDPDTGLKPSQGAHGLDDKSASPTDTTKSVGKSKATTISKQNVTLPYETTVLTTAGQQVTVSAQNGTSDTNITVTVNLNGHTVTKSASGVNAAVAVSSQEAK